MTDKKRGWLFVLVFIFIFILLWKQPITDGSMNIRDWMRLIVLEIPLQLAVHYLTGKKCN